MRWIGGSGCGRRWRSQLAAYIDGELTPAEARRLEEHLGTCAGCREETASTRAVKSILAASLAPLPAPRSFAISEAMLAKGREPLARPVGFQAAAARFAPVAAAVALIGLVTLLTVDLRSSGNAGGSNSTAAPVAAQDSAAPLSTGDAPGAPADGRNSKSAGATVPPYNNGGVEGQSLPSTVPQPATPAAGFGAGAAPDEGHGTAGATGGGVLATAPAAAHRESGSGWYRPAEVAALIVFAVAIGIYVIAHRTSRRSHHV